MRRSRFTEAQILGVMKQAEAGTKTTEVCRQHGISNATFYKRKRRYGGLEVSEARRLRPAAAGKLRVGNLTREIRRKRLI